MLTKYLQLASLLIHLFLIESWKSHDSKTVISFNVGGEKKKNSFFGLKKLKSNFYPRAVIIIITLQGKSR